MKSAQIASRHKLSQIACSTFGPQQAHTETWAEIRQQRPTGNHQDQPTQICRMYSGHLSNKGPNAKSSMDIQEASGEAAVIVQCSRDECFDNIKHATFRVTTPQQAMQHALHKAESLQGTL